MELAERLASQPLILPIQSSGVRIAFDAFVDRIDVRPQVAAEIDDMAMMRLMAREGVGLAVIPPIVVKDELISGRLTEADQLPDMTETFYAVTTERRYPNPEVRTLMQ